MRRYFFHRHLYGTTYVDRKGICFANLQAARAEAIPAAIEMLEETTRASLQIENVPIDWRMWVVDEDGNTLCTIRFQVEEFVRQDT